MRAVSIKMSNGKTVTLMPFASIEVKRGAKVSEGQQLGTLAASGDISSSGVHLHMGLKKGRTYYDPMTLFGVKSTVEAALPARERAKSKQAAPLSKPQVQAQPQTEAKPQVQTQTQPQPESQARPQTQPERESSRARKKAGEPSAAPSSESAKERLEAKTPHPAWQPGTVSSGNVSWQPSVEDAKNPLATVGAALAPLTQACSSQAASLILGLQNLSQGTGIPQWAVYIAALALGLVVLTASIWAGVRWGVPFVGSLWRRLNAHWNSGNKRGKLLGLFPAPGSAFIPRGR